MVVLTKHWANSVSACAPEGQFTPQAGLFSSRVSAINIRRAHSPSRVIRLCL